QILHEKLMPRSWGGTPCSSTIRLPVVCNAPCCCTGVSCCPPSPDSGSGEDEQASIAILVRQAMYMLRMLLIILFIYLKPTWSIYTTPAHPVSWKVSSVMVAGLPRSANGSLYSTHSPSVMVIT